MKKLSIEKCKHPFYETVKPKDGKAGAPEEHECPDCGGLVTISFVVVHDLRGHIHDVEGRFIKSVRKKN